MKSCTQEARIVAGGVLAYFKRTTRPLLVSILLLGMSTPAFAQKARMYDVEHVAYDLQSGVRSNGGDYQEVVFRYEIRHPDAAWVRLEFSDVLLNAGDWIHIVGLERGVEQTIAKTDPQYSDPNFEGKIISVIFKGGNVDIALSLAPGSQGAEFTLNKILVARGPLAAPRTICGPADDRIPLADACVVRVVDSQGGWASGFMISDNWMITAHHVMTFGPWTIQRNVQPSDAADGGINPPANAADQFTVANLDDSTTSGVEQLGNDWAVVELPNNAQGAPGAGCSPTFDCNYENSTAGAQLTVDGFGLDTENVRNGVLQTETGDSVAGGNNPSHFKYRVDTRRNGSGGPVTDANGRIVGIHTDGGCDGNDPETGSNSGTLITNAGLLMAIKTRCDHSICLVPPPDAPDWWGDEDCGDFYAFANWDKPPSSSPPNDAEHWDSNWLGSEAFTITTDGLNVTMTLQNSKLPDYVKAVYIHITGSSTGGGAPTNLNIVGDNSPSGQPDSQWQGDLTPASNGNTWTIKVDGRFTPQPDLVVFTFTMPTGGQLTQAWAGECCTLRPIPTVSEWGLIVMTLLGMTIGTIMIVRQRRRAAA